MEIFLIAVTIFSIVIVTGYLYWRHIWFFRNPPRKTPREAGILSPADGTVVYVKRVNSYEKVLSIKKGITATLTDILREDISAPKILIGIFMSPFDVHYNRIPLSGEIAFIRHHEPKGRNLMMGSMHLRTLLGWTPFYRNSSHIIQNERRVTRINGTYGSEPLPYYIVQIAGGKVNGIDTYVDEGAQVERGSIFSMIRIGSQVDLVVPWKPDMNIITKQGDKVRAGETILIT